MRYEETQCERDDIHYAGNLEMRHKISRKVKGGGGLWKTLQGLAVLIFDCSVLVGFSKSSYGTIDYVGC